MSRKKFKTEVDQLLHLIVHSLYSHKEIFLRELVSNASDAIEKLRYLTMTDDAFKSFEFSPRIDISFENTQEEKTITISDNGIGMDSKELEENLGTIARSGTRRFIENFTGDTKRDSNLIGQFGVGFYSAFMVADKVEVTSRKAGTDQAFSWVSDGKSGYDTADAQRDGHGTTVKLFLSSEGYEFASRWSVENAVKKYSNHIPFPIHLHYESVRYEGTGDDEKEVKEDKVEQINAASSLWKRGKSELKHEDYVDFYKSLTYDTEEPMLYVHTQAEGKIDYSTLFYIPAKAPFDMFRVDYSPGVKLYVKRVFIMDDAKELLPSWLRFVKGVIDSEDLPLNVSREILQRNAVLQKIVSSSTKKIIGELEELKTKDREKYVAFYREFGIPVKEGLYQDYANREKILELVMYKSTHSPDGLTSLAEYKERMSEGQKFIYYATGAKEDDLRRSPLLEMYSGKGIEVLLMDDGIDEIVLSAVNKYCDIEFKSVNRKDAGEELKTEEDKDQERKSAPVVEKIKTALGDLVKDVRASTRLSDSPSCIVADDADPTVQMQNILKAMGHKEMAEVKPLLEVNPSHEIVKGLETVDDPDKIKDISVLLLEGAMLIEGMELKSNVDFVRRLNRVLSQGLR